MPKLTATSFSTLNAEKTRGFQIRNEMPDFTWHAENVAKATGRFQLLPCFEIVIRRPFITL